MTKSGIPIAYARTPFASDVYRGALPYGLTVAEILDTIPELPDRAWTHGIVCLNFVTNGEAHCDQVPREWWGLVRLTERPIPVTVTVHIPLGFGGGGSGEGAPKKSTFALIATIALIAATTAISAGALGPAGLAIAGGYLAAGSTSAALLSAGIGIVGSLAIAALTAPPTLDTPTDDTSRESGSASASGNQLDPGGIIPRSIGRFRASPSLAAMPLVDIDGDDQIVECIFCMAGPHRWTNIWIDKIPIENDEAFQFVTREGWNTDQPINLVERQGFTDSPSLELSQHQIDLDDGEALKDQDDPANSLPKFNTIVTRRAPDEVWLTVLFAEGMIFGDDDSDETMNIPVRLKIRPRGTTTWLNLPEIHFSWRGSSPFRKMIKLKWANLVGGMNLPREGYAPVYAFKQVPGQTIDPIGIGGWSAHSHFSAGAGDDLYSASTIATTNVRNVSMYYDRVEFYLGPKDTPAGDFSYVNLTGSTDPAVWEIQLKRGQPYAGGEDGAFEPSTYVYGDEVYDFFGYYDKLDGTHSILEQTQNARQKIIIAAIASVWNEHPIGGTGLALLAIKARNKAIQNVSALLGGYVPDWGGVAWSDWSITSNPAPNFRYLLTGAVNADPLPDSLLDNNNLLEWRTRCETDNLTCDMIADGRNSDSILTVIAGCGYARPRQSELWGVAQDKDRTAESPVQILTPINSRGFRFDKALPVLPHAFSVEFRDRALDYEKAPELIVYAAGYNADGSDGKKAATRIENISYDGLVTESSAIKRATFDLAQAIARSTFYSMEVNAEALVTTKGDLLGVQHDILKRDAGFARIKSKTVVSGEVTKVLLNSKIPTALGADFFSLPNLIEEDDIFSLVGTTGISIRLRDGSGFIVHQRLSDSVDYIDEVHFTDPFDDPGDSLSEGCLISSGEYGSEYLRLLLMDVRPGPGLTASITLVDEAPDLWSLEGFDLGSFDDSFDSSFG